MKRWTLLTINECKAVQEWIIWLSSFDNSPDFMGASFGRALDTIDLLIERCRTLESGENEPVNNSV